MRTRIRWFTLLLCLPLAGCGPKWVKLDNSEASAEEIEKAKISCNVDYQLAQIEDMKKIVATEQNPTIREAYATALERNEGKTYAEIDHCMWKRGLKQPYSE